MDNDILYPRGSIKRVRLKDFMSFVGTVVLEAGSRVNVVEGPNGSGKSSLVTALCVGLAGSMKSLGRQTRPDELIRRGCAAFEVEITLSGGPGQPDIVVHRRTERASLGAGRGRKRRRGAGDGVEDGDSDDGADSSDEDGEGGAAAAGGGGGRSSCHTTWQIDGRGVAEARVKELAKGMGIHFDNLCQFLPQERVVAFSNLGPTELLESTEEAIGGGHLLAQHTELGKRSAALKIKREELQRTRDQLVRVEGQQAASAPEYQRLQRRNELRKEVEKLRSKGLWLEKERRREQHGRARAAAAAVVGRAEAARQRLAAEQAPLNKRNRELEAARREAAAQEQQTRTLDAEVRRGLEALRRHQEQLKAKEEQLAGLKDKSNRWRADRARAARDLDQVRADRAALPAGLSPAQNARVEALELEIQQAAGEVGFLEFQLGQKRREVEQLAAQVRALEEAQRRRQDLRERRLRLLERDLPLSRRLYEWITRMREEGRFRRRVLGPLLMEILPVANPVWAAQLEFIVGKNNLGALACEDLHDNNLIQDWIKHERGQRRVRGNKLMFLENGGGGGGGAAAYPHGEAGQYAKYGITHTVDQLFEASSELVKDALRLSSGIHTAFVGTEQVVQPAALEALLRETPVRRLLSPSTVAMVSVSEYDPTHVSTKIMDLPAAKLLSDAAAPGEGDEAAERQQLDARRKATDDAEAEAQQLAAALQQRQEAARALQVEKTQLLGERRRLEQSALNLAHREAEVVRRLSRLEGEGDPMAQAGQLRDALCRDAEALLRQARDAAALIARQHQQHRRLAVSELSLAAASASLAPLQQAVRRAQEGLEAAERDAAAAARQEERAAARLAEADEALRSELGGRGPDAALRAAWQQWPDDVGELEQLLAAKQAEMEQAQAALRGDEAAVVEAWQRREVEIARLRQEAAAGAGEVQAAEADVEARKSAWLPELQRHMEAINEAVRAHFAAIGCAGEVVLREAGDVFEEYAAEIRVQYRPDEPLRPLNRNHHSGGERSVATMLYLMALQGVTTTPFRVVDEINQGMDSNNERRVFNLLVECSSRPDTPQCFLLTPKFISNLRFNDHVRVQPLRCATTRQVHVQPPAAAQLAAEAEEVANGGAAAAGTGGGGGGGGGGRQRHQPRPGAVQTLGQMPWQQMKNLLLYGHAAMAGQG